MMKKRFVGSLPQVFGLALFALALWVLHRELKVYHYQDIIRHLKAIPSRRILVAILLTGASYLVMTGYDFLAIRHIKNPLRYGRIAFTSFVSYVFSNNVGLFILSGGGVRYRIYSTMGLSAVEITQVVAFCMATFWLGLFTVGGVAFTFFPFPLPASLHAPFLSVRPLGFVLAALALVYLLWSFVRRAPLKILQWEFDVPTPRFAFSQMVVASLDWILASSVLYWVLPAMPDLSFVSFMGIFLLAMISGLVSQVPGGIGVFETVMVLLLSSRVTAPQVLGSLLVYRGVYYLLPLIAGTILIGVYEVSERKEGVKRMARLFGRSVPWLVPNVLSFTVFVGGAILLASGATPSAHRRLTWLKHVLPLPLMEISHFLGSLAGVGLLLLARGIQRRLDAAYFLTALLLGAGIVFSLLKGLDYEEATLLAIMLAALLPCHRAFYRKASLFHERLTAGWIAAIAFVVLGSLWLGFFSYKHVEYSQELWWRFAFFGDAPRFLRASVGVITAIVIVAFSSLLQPSQPEPTLPDESSLEKAEGIIAKSRKTPANLALLGDKSLLFSENGEAFIMYGVEGRSWVAMGDPVGPEEERVELVWRFRELCERHGGWTVFYEVGEDTLPLYVDVGLTLLKIGEEARVPLRDFSLEGSERKGLRYVDRKMEKTGCTFEVVPVEGVLPLLPELRNISDVWLADKKTKEKGFSLGSFQESYLRHFPVAVVRKEGKIIAFANVWPGAGKEEISIDLMRHLPEAPHGVMEYLFVRLILWSRGEGYQWFSLGMAPLAGIENHPFAPLWNRIGALLFRHGEHFYNFQGLRSYKGKFDPEWSPKYLASPAGLALPRILTHIASLISGGIKGALTK